MQKNNYGVIMAGGVGSRFWPMSKASLPKQFIDILGTGRSLLQQSFDRLLDICPSHQIYIVTNEMYRKITLEQLPEISTDQVLCEPMKKNTAPCIAYANFKIKALNADANIVVTPSDHLIMKQDVFSSTIIKSLDYASTKNVLLTIGIEPSRPDTGYGYINFEKYGSDFRKVLSFTEKPDLENAKIFMNSGDYSWNSGMFIWNVNSVDTALRTYLSDLYQLFDANKESLNSDKEEAYIRQVYSNCQNISIDYGIMEKANNVEVINADLGWSDLGTWGSLYEHIPKDDQNNAIVGNNVLTFNSERNIIHLPNDKFLVTQGLNDFIVVDHDNILLICNKKEEQQIKAIVEYIELNKGSDLV